MDANQETAFDKYQYENDLLGNKVKLVKERQNLPEDTGVFEYIYDPLSRLQEVIKNKGQKVVYNYDELLRLSEVVDGNSKTKYHYKYSRLIEKLHPSRKVYRRRHCKRTCRKTTDHKSLLVLLKFAF